jgi:hypothetical protein
MPKARNVVKPAHLVINHDTYIALGARDSWYGFELSWAEHHGLALTFAHHGRSSWRVTGPAEDLAIMRAAAKAYVAAEQKWERLNKLAQQAEARVESVNHQNEVIKATSKLLQKRRAA